MKFMAISPSAVDTAWPKLSVGIEDVLPYSLAVKNPREIREQVANGEWLMFAVFEDDTPVVTLIATIKDGQQRIFEVGLCWGKRVDEWITDVYQMFEVIALECGCSRIVFNGRPGWHKLAKQHGFTINAYVYGRDI